MSNLILMCVLGLALPQSTLEEENGHYILQFDESSEGGLSLDAFIKICQEVTGFNFTYTEEEASLLGSTRIRIFGRKRIPKTEFYSFFQIVMKVYGFACVEIGAREKKVILITSLKGSRSHQIKASSVFLVRPEDTDRYADQPAVMVTAFFPLKYRDARQVSNSLRPYLDQSMEMASALADDLLMVQCFGPTASAIRRVIESFDIPPEEADPPVLEFLPLEFAAAEEILPLLEDLIEKRRGSAPANAGGRGNGRGSGSRNKEFHLTADPRTNSLLIQAPRTEIGWILELVHRLDRKLDRPESNFRIYPLRNTKAVEVAQVLNDFFQERIRSHRDGNRTTPRGPTAPITREQEDRPVVIPDEKTNSLLVTASKTVWAEIKYLLQELDVRQPQVLIETALVELTVENTFGLGVELGKISGSSLPEKGDPGKPFGFSSFGLTNVADLDGDGFPESRTVEGLGTGVLAGIITGEDIGVPALVSALATDNQANILSVPSVLVMNGKEASISSEQIVHTATTNQTGTGLQSTSSGPPVTSGIQLGITPTISAENYLRLDINVNVSAFSGDSPSDNVAPPQVQRSMKTHVFVPDSATLFIGGVVQESGNQGETGVPILKDIPILGTLFRSSSKSAAKTTLFFFITPRILRQNDFTDLLDIAYRKKIEADSVIGAGVVGKIDPAFQPLRAPGTGRDSKVLESRIFDVPLYSSPGAR